MMRSLSVLLLLFMACIFAGCGNPNDPIIDPIRSVPSDQTPAWSPDGEQIVYIGAESDIWIMDADGSNKKQLTRNRGLILKQDN